MESLQIKTGSISLMILDDLGNERGIFTFNPEDVESARQVLLLQDEINERMDNFGQQVQEATENADKVAIMSETINYLRGCVDQCFGEGTSDLVFGKSHTLSMFIDFLNGITPYYAKAAEKRKAKYKKQK